MKPEPTKPPLPLANRQEDPQLWELLGKSTHAPAPDDFLSQVLSRVNELEARGGTRQPLKRSLADRWDGFVDALLGFSGNSGIRLAGALAILAVICGLGFWPDVLPTKPTAGNPPSLNAGNGGFTMTTRQGVGTGDATVYQDAEMQTILQLDDYLAFADQQSWLDPESASFLP